MADQVRIGVLGAARIAPSAIVKPARKLPQVTLSAIAARNPQRASAFASKHHIPRVLASYDELIADPDLDAVYIPLPNGLHYAWTLKALAAGKHVLCEKPFAANAAEAEQMVAAAEGSGRVLMEAFHYRYHPLGQRMKEVVTSGQLGKIQHIETWMCFPLPLFNDIRYRYDLAGGALMDAGCYAVNMLRWLAGTEPEVTSAEARL
ncbi:MAG TPA: Gfo/Idh/MocA family oxidoreductase, partial [Ktedonobacterales bacterium]